VRSGFVTYVDDDSVYRRRTMIGCRWVTWFQRFVVVDLCDSWEKTRRGWRENDRVQWPSVRCSVISCQLYRLNSHKRTTL